jgi:hypothetical protein
MPRYSPPEVQHNPIRLAEVLAALSLATDLGAGRSMGQAMRACILGMRLAGELRLPEQEQAELYSSGRLRSLTRRCPTVESPSCPASSTSPWTPTLSCSLEKYSNFCNPN